MLRRLTSVLLALSIFSLIVCGPSRAEAATSSLPTMLQNVTYQFSDTVKFLDLSTATKVGDNIRLPGATLSAGDVVVDKVHETSLKVLKVNSDGTVVAGKPTMIELFKEFTIPRQIIQPNTANITEFAVKGISIQDYMAKLAAPTTEPGGEQKVMSGTMPTLMNDISAIFQQRGTKVYEYKGVYEFTPFSANPFAPSSGTVKLALDGSLGVSPGVVAEYSLFGGYEFGFVDAAQFIKLNMMFDVAVKEEVYLPVFAITIPIPGLGGVRLGVYLVVDVDGDITLTVKAEEGIIANASVYGGTTFGIPTSFHLNTGLEQYYGADCDPMGYIEAGLYITPLVNLDILDVDVFGAQLRLGFYGYANITEQTMDYGVDFVIHAFVIILDDRTDLIKVNIPIVERSKSFREQDSVVFYFSRLCVYQDRINVAAMAKRPVGVTDPNASPFSDKLPFSNRDLEIWYYRAGNDPHGGTNQNPNYKIVSTPESPLRTDDRGCIGVDFASVKGPGFEHGIDVQKDDVIKIMAPGFTGETDLIKSVSPFGAGKLPGQTDFYGLSTLPGDYFEDMVYFKTLSGWDLTGLDVPNTEGFEFVPKPRIYYEGPVTIYSTDKDTGITESAWFQATQNGTEYKPLKKGLQLSAPSIGGLPGISNAYNVKPNNEMRWQINEGGYIYGTYEPTGTGGPETTAALTIKRVVEDKKVVIEDYDGDTIGLQHNVALRVIAVNKAGSKPYRGTADLYYALGKVPAGYVQTLEVDKSIIDMPYARFPAAAVGYPNHYEYYTSPPFPVMLYEKKDAPGLVVDPSNNKPGTVEAGDVGTVSQAHYFWRWEERVPDVPSTVSVDMERTTLGPTGAPITVIETEERPNVRYMSPFHLDLSEFSDVPISYTVYDPMAGKGMTPGELQGTEPATRDVYQMRHIVSGVTVEGVPFEDPALSPPAPIVQKEPEFVTDASKKFDIEFQLHLMKEHSDRFVVSPLEQSIFQQYKTAPAIMRNTAVKPAVTIANVAALPQWARGYISLAVNNEIMALDSQGRFQSGNLTTRSEFSAAIVNALGLTSADAVRTGFTFKDVDPADSNLAAMQIAYQCGIINGTSATTFEPGGRVTRQDASAMLMRAFNMRNSNLVPSDSVGRLGTFSDQALVRDYALSSFEQSVRMGFFNGYEDSTLRPLNNISNAETAKIVWEMKTKAEKPGVQWVQ